MVGVWGVEVSVGECENGNGQLKRGQHRAHGLTKSRDKMCMEKIRRKPMGWVGEGMSWVMTTKWIRASRDQIGIVTRVRL